MQAFRYDEEEKEFLILCANLDSTAAFETVIQNMIAIIEDFDTKKHGTYLQIEFVNSNDEYLDFWEALMATPQTLPLAKKYLEYCIAYLEKGNKVWEDAEDQLAGYISYQLAWADKQFISYYSQLLGVWDMDHEVAQQEHISAIAYRHGWCEEVEKLIISRATIGVGQHGFEQLVDFEDFIRKHQTPLKESDFFQSLVNEVDAYHGDGTWQKAEDINGIFGGMAKEAIEILKNR